MRTAMRLLVAGILLGVPVGAQGQAKVTPEQAAARVIAAVEANDQAALEALARDLKPGPWSVAEELCFQGKHDAAAAFAKLAPRNSAEKLPAYVASRHGTPPDREAKEAFLAARSALIARNPKRALEIVGAITGPVDSIQRARIEILRGFALRSLRRHDESIRCFTTVAQFLEELGAIGRAGAAYHQAGITAKAISDWETARAVWVIRLRLYRSIEDAASIAWALSDLGYAYKHTGKYQEALQHFEAALEIELPRGDKRIIAAAHNDIGTIHERLGSFDKALQGYQAALAIWRATGDRSGIAIGLNNIGNVHQQRGAYAKSLEQYEEALVLHRALRNRVGIAQTMQGMGLVHQRSGRYSEALRRYAAALAILRELGHRPSVAIVLNNLGGLQSMVGNDAEALEHFEASLAISRALKDKPGIAAALRNIGLMHRRLGDRDTALKHFEASLTIELALGNKATIAGALMTIGEIHLSRDESDEAIAIFRRSLELREAMGDKSGTASVLQSIATAHEHRGEMAEALTMLKRARLLLAESPAKATQARVSWAMARNHMRQKQPAKAVEEARRGVRIVNSMSEGLAEGQGAGARDLFVGLFNVGYDAASVAGDTEALLWFLEQGRAGSLRESLGSRGALERAVIPEELHEALATARRAETNALVAYKRAHRSRKRKAIRTARKAWEQSRAEVNRVAKRIEVEARHAAAVTLAEPDDLAGVQSHLAPGDVLLYYAVTNTRVLALVLQENRARVVALATAEDVDAATRSLLSGEQHVDPAKVSAVRTLLVDPLELGEDVKRVLVSPMGALGYVPFILLLPEREVVFIPSGSTYGLLRAEPGPQGDHVLALGDPDYQSVVNQTALALHRAGAVLKLAQLPATRGEVESVGTTKLLGKDASEAGLAAAITKQKRWRAVHFACHGLINPEKPMLSSLALTADRENDGFLTALEIFRMKIPADLVVMSACETGKGRIYQTEGIVGLTRAFMFAGSPRVICSLWKVDDEATRALMVKFYELWMGTKVRKGLPTATALKKAQEFVRSHKTWEHPYYWAAWQLWGLPD